MKSLIRRLKNMLKWGNYQCLFVFDLPPAKVFQSLTADIPEWWSRQFEGESDQADRVFTVRFGSTFKTMLVKELIPNKKVIWEVRNAHLDLPDLENKTEWVGTTIVWEIIEDDELSRLVLTHKGLNSDLECFEACENGWSDFTGSLSNYLNTGQGQPYDEKAAVPKAGLYVPGSYGLGTPVRGKLK